MQELEKGSVMEPRLELVLKELLKFELVLALKFELVLVQKIKLVLPLVPKCSQLRVVRKRFHLALVLVPE